MGGAAPCPSWLQLQGIEDATDPCQQPNDGSLNTGCFDFVSGQAIDCDTGQPFLVTNPQCLDGSAVCDAFGNVVGTSIDGSNIYNDPGAASGGTTAANLPKPSGTGGAGAGSVIATLGSFVGGVLKGVGLVGNTNTTPGSIGARPVGASSAGQQTGLASVLGGSIGVWIVIGVLVFVVIVREGKR